MDSYLTHTGVEAYKFRAFDTTCYAHILDLSHARIKLVRGFMSVDARAKEMGAQLAFNANGWGLQPNGTNLSNEYLVIEGQVIQATAIDYRPCMNITKDGVIEFLDRPNLQTVWNVIGFDRYIARKGIYNSQINNNESHPRTIYGTDASGCLIILVCEGRTATEKGLTFAECWTIMQDFGATDCGNADGGYSSCAYNTFFGGLIDESYKVEYRRTVMQVLFFANQLGEVPPPLPPPPLPTGAKMFEVKVSITERAIPSMYSTGGAIVTAGTRFESSKSVLGDPSKPADKNVLFEQLPNGKWLPRVYNGITYLEAVSVVPPTTNDTFTATIKDDATGEVWTGTLTKQ
jgi:hypothetical protein